jgi:hypothetical protein
LGGENVSIEFTPESWMFDEDGQLLRDEALYHKAMNEYYAEKYAGLSKPIIGDDIYSLAEPEWALRNLIQADGLTMVHGSPASGKSLMAMDWAYTLAHPRLTEWAGQPKNRNYRPMYIFTEGLSGLQTRSIAWRMEKGMETPSGEHGVVWVRDSVRLNRTDDPKEPWSSQVTALFQMYNDYERDILFVDTLANTFGGNENSQQDANNYLAALRMFQQGGPVVIIHHNTKEGKEFRGSTVFEGAVDTKVAVELRGHDIVHLWITKQKDGDPNFGMDLKIKPHSWLGSSNRELESVALEKMDWQAPRLTARQLEYVEVVQDLGPDATLNEIALRMEVQRSAASEMLIRLEEEGWLTKDESSVWYKALEEL